MGTVVSFFKSLVEVCVVVPMPSHLTTTDLRTLFVTIPARTCASQVAGNRRLACSSPSAFLALAVTRSPIFKPLTMTQPMHGDENKNRP